jgi:predicted nucleic acid-binding protein
LILIDTSGLLAALNSHDRHHRAAVAVLRSTPPPRLLSPFVLAELDYLLAARVGEAAERSLLAEVGRGAYTLEQFSAEDVSAAVRVIDRYGEATIGLADASVVVLADRHGIGEVLTLDERRFRILRWGQRRRFTLLPADAR